MVNFPLQVIMMKKVPREYLARVASIFNAVALCFVPLASFIIGIISEFINIKSLFMLFGIAVIILFVIQNFSKVMKKYDEC